MPYQCRGEHIYLFDYPLHLDIKWHTAKSYLVSEFPAKGNAKGAARGSGPVSIEGYGVLEPEAMDEHR